MKLIDRIQTNLLLVAARINTIETLDRNPVLGFSLTDDMNNLKIESQLVIKVIPFDGNNETMCLC
ncbi:hypothetical protein [Listeria monocytogenes]|uniref:hypothetical protein n=1 Tax=Listeria monocytogenes TaxID=1639 RepID=UPI001F1819D5|nr:hypothetical protein [Listeria monocytogenes]